MFNIAASPIFLLRQTLTMYAHLLKQKADYMKFFYRNILFQYNFSGKRILEIGCGRRGWLSLLLNQHCRVQTVTTDIEPSKVQTAHKIAQEVGCESKGYVAADSMNLPFRPRTFDMVVGNAILHHLLKNINRAAKQMEHCLTASGEIVFSGEIVASKPIASLMQLAYKLTKSDEGVTTKHQWTHAFQQANFHKVTITQENRANYTTSKPKKLLYRIMKFLPSQICINLLVTSCTITARKTP